MVSIIILYYGATVVCAVRRYAAHDCIHPDDGYYLADICSSH